MFLARPIQNNPLGAGGQLGRLANRRPLSPLGTLSLRRSFSDGDRHFLVQIPTSRPLPPSFLQYRGALATVRRDMLLLTVFGSSSSSSSLLSHCPARRYYCVRWDIWGYGTLDQTVKEERSGTCIAGYCLGAAFRACSQVGRGSGAAAFCEIAESIL